jgi:hypothetical protein
MHVTAFWPDIVPGALTNGTQITPTITQTTRSEATLE